MSTRLLRSRNVNTVHASTNFPFAFTSRRHRHTNCIVHSRINNSAALRPLIVLSPPSRPFHSTIRTMGDAEAKNQKSSSATEEWKKRAPYRIHENSDDFHTRYEASCHCGKVTYQLSRDEPLDSKLCHCTTCQTQHAAPFQWAAIFHKEDINFTNGHHDLEWYDPSTKSIEHKLPCKVRCSFCHSPIMDEGRNMILLFPSLIKLTSDEARSKFKPRCHMFYEQRLMDIPDGLPKWTGLNETSELIEDSPPELVRKREREREEERSKRFKKGENE